MGAVATGVAVTAVSLAASVGGMMLAKSMASSTSTPTPPTPTTMPVLNQQAVNNATQQQSQQAAATSGRMSTVLSQATGNADKLG